MAAAIAVDRRFTDVTPAFVDLFDTPDEREPDDNRPDAICDLDPSDLFDIPDEREPDDNRPDAVCDLEEYQP